MNHGRLLQAVATKGVMHDVRGDITANGQIKGVRPP